MVGVVRRATGQWLVMAGLIVLLAGALQLARPDAAQAATYRASDHPTMAGWGYSRAFDGSGRSRKWEHTPRGWSFGWRVDFHRIYIHPMPGRGWSWTWCNCQGGMWSAAHSRDLVITRPVSRR